MGFTWLITARLSTEGAKDITASGMTAARDAFADAIGSAPTNSRILSWYAADNHEWDIVIIGHSDNDDPAFWAKSQITRGRATGHFAESRLIRLVSAEDFDAAKLDA